MNSNRNTTMNRTSAETSTTQHPDWSPSEQQKQQRNGNASNANGQQGKKNGSHSHKNLATRDEQLLHDREVDFSSNPTILSQLILNRKFQSAIKRLRNHPEEASVWICYRKQSALATSKNEEEGEHQQECYEDRLHHHPLQLPFLDRRDSWPAPNPNTALHHQEEYCLRQLPLHVACNSLIRTSPFYYNSIRNSMKNNNKNSREELELLVAHLTIIYPHACAKRDHEGRLPLHEAISWTASPEIISILLMAFPEALLERDRHGRCPQQLAAAAAAAAKRENDGSNERQLQSHTQTVSDLLRRGVDFWLQARSEALIRKKKLGTNSQQPQQPKPKQQLAGSDTKHVQSIQKEPKSHIPTEQHEKQSQRESGPVTKKEGQRHEDSSTTKSKGKSDNSVLEWKIMLLEKGLKESQRKNAELGELVKKLRKEQNESYDRVERSMESNLRTKLLEVQDENSDLKKKISQAQITFRDMGLDDSGFDPRQFDDDQQEPEGISVMGMDPERPTVLTNYLENKVGMFMSENDALVLENQRYKKRVQELESKIAVDQQHQDTGATIPLQNEKISENEQLLIKKVAELEKLLIEARRDNSRTKVDVNHSAKNQQSPVNEVDGQSEDDEEEYGVSEFDSGASSTYPSSHSTASLLKPVAKPARPLPLTPMSSSNSERSITSWGLLSLNMNQASPRKQHKRNKNMHMSYKDLQPMPVLAQGQNSSTSFHDSLSAYANNATTDNLDELYKDAADMYNDFGNNSASFLGCTLEDVPPMGKFPRAARRFSDSGICALENRKKMFEKESDKARKSADTLATPARILAAEEECNSIMREVENRLRTTLPRELALALQQAYFQLAANLNQAVRSGNNHASFHPVADAFIDYKLVDEAQKIYGEKIPTEIIASVRAISLERVGSTHAAVNTISQMKVKIKQELINSLIEETESQLSRPLEYDQAVSLEEASKTFESLLYEVTSADPAASSAGMRLDFKEMNKMFKEAQRLHGAPFSKDVIYGLRQASFVLQSRLEGTDIKGKYAALAFKGSQKPSRNDMGPTMKGRTSSNKPSAELLSPTKTTAFVTVLKSPRGEGLVKPSEFAGEVSMDISNVFPVLSHVTQNNNSKSPKTEEAQSGAEHRLIENMPSLSPKKMANETSQGRRSRRRRRMRRSSGSSSSSSRKSDASLSDEGPGAMYRKAREGSRSPTQRIKEGLLQTPLSGRPAYKRVDSDSDLSEILHRASRSRTSSPTPVDGVDSAGALDLLSDCETVDSSIGSRNSSISPELAQTYGGIEPIGVDSNEFASSFSGVPTKTIEASFEKLINSLVQEVNVSGAEIGADLADSIKKALFPKVRNKALSSGIIESEAYFVSSIARYLRDDGVIDEATRLYGKPISMKPLSMLLSVADSKAASVIDLPHVEHEDNGGVGVFKVMLNGAETELGKPLPEDTMHALLSASTKNLSLDEHEANAEDPLSNQVNLESILETAEQLLGRSIPSDLKAAIHRAQEASERKERTKGGIQERPTSETDDSSDPENLDILTSMLEVKDDEKDIRKTRYKDFEKSEASLDFDVIFPAESNSSDAQRKPKKLQATPKNATPNETSKLKNIAGAQKKATPGETSKLRSLSRGQKKANSDKTSSPTSIGTQSAPNSPKPKTPSRGLRRTASSELSQCAPAGASSERKSDKPSAKMMRGGYNRRGTLTHSKSEDLSELKKYARRESLRGRLRASKSGINLLGMAQSLAESLAPPGTDNLDELYKCAVQQVDSARGVEKSPQSRKTTQVEKNAALLDHMPNSTGEAALESIITDTEATYGIDITPDLVDSLRRAAIDTDEDVPFISIVRSLHNDDVIEEAEQHYGKPIPRDLVKAVRSVSLPPGVSVEKLLSVDERRSKSYVPVPDDTRHDKSDNVHPTSSQQHQVSPKSAASKDHMVHIKDDSRVEAVSNDTEETNSIPPNQIETEAKLTKRASLDTSTHPDDTSWGILSLSHSPTAGRTDRLKEGQPNKRRMHKKATPEFMNSLADLDGLDGEASVDDDLGEIYDLAVSALEDYHPDESGEDGHASNSRRRPSSPFKGSRAMATDLDPVMEMSGSLGSLEAETVTFIDRPQLNTSCMKVSPQELELDILFDAVKKSEGISIPWDLDLAIRKASRSTDESLDFITPAKRQAALFRFGTHLTLGRLEVLYEEAEIFLGYRLPPDLVDALRRSATMLKDAEGIRRDLPSLKKLERRNETSAGVAEKQDEEDQGSLAWERERDAVPSSPTTKLSREVLRSSPTTRPFRDVVQLSPTTKPSRDTVTLSPTAKASRDIVKSSSTSKPSQDARVIRKQNNSKTSNLIAARSNLEADVASEEQKVTSKNDDKVKRPLSFRTQSSLDSYFSGGRSAETDDLEEMYRSARSVEGQPDKQSSSLQKPQGRKRESSLNRSNHSFNRSNHSFNHSNHSISRSSHSSDTLVSVALSRETDDLDALFQVAYTMSPRVELSPAPSPRPMSPRTPSFTRTPTSKSTSRVTQSSKSHSTKKTTNREPAPPGPPAYHSPPSRDFPVKEVSTPDRFLFCDDNEISPMTLGSTLTDGSESRESRELETKDLLNASRARLQALSNSIPELDLMGIESDTDEDENALEADTPQEDKPEKDTSDENMKQEIVGDQESNDETMSVEDLRNEDGQDEDQDMPDLVSMVESSSRSVLEDSSDSIQNGTSELNAIISETQAEFGMELPAELVEALRCTSVSSLFSDSGSFNASDVSSLMQSYLQEGKVEKSVSSHTGSTPVGTLAKKSPSENQSETEEKSSQSSVGKLRTQVNVEDDLNILTQNAEKAMGCPIPRDVLRALRQAVSEDTPSDNGESLSLFHKDGLERLLSKAAQSLETALPNDVLEALRQASTRVESPTNVDNCEESVESLLDLNAGSASGYFSGSSDGNSIPTEALGNNVHNILAEVKNVHGEVPGELLETLQKVSDDDPLDSSLDFDYSGSILMEYSSSTIGSFFQNSRRSLCSVGSAGKASATGQTITRDDDLEMEHEKTADIDLFIYEATKEYGKPLPKDLVVALRSSSAISLESDLNSMISHAEEACGQSLSEEIAKALQNAASYSEIMSSEHSGLHSSLSSATTLNNSADSSTEWTLDDSIDIDGLLDKVTLEAEIPPPPPPLPLPETPTQSVGTPTSTTSSKKVVNKNLGPNLLVKVKRVYTKKIPLELSYVLSRSDELSYARNTDEDIDIILTECEEMSGKQLPADLVVALREASVALRKAQASSSRSRRNRVNRQSSGSYRSSSRSSGGMPSIQESTVITENEVENSPSPEMAHGVGKSNEEGCETSPDLMGPSFPQDARIFAEPQHPAIITMHDQGGTDFEDVSTLRSTESGGTSLSSGSPPNYARTFNSEPSLTLDDLMLSSLVHIATPHNPPPVKRPNPPASHGRSEESLTLDDIMEPSPHVGTQHTTTKKPAHVHSEESLTLDDIMQPSMQSMMQKKKSNQSTESRFNSSEETEPASNLTTGIGKSSGSKPRPFTLMESHVETEREASSAPVMAPVAQNNNERRVLPSRPEDLFSEREPHQAEFEPHQSEIENSVSSSATSSTSNLSRVSSASTLLSKKTPLGVESTPPIDGVESDDLNAIFQEAARRYSIG